MASDDQINVKFGASTEDLNDGISSVSEQLNKLKELAIEAFTIHEIDDFISKFADIGTEVERASAEFGMAAGQVQEWGYAMQASGASSDSMNMIMLRLQRSMDAALQKAGPQREAFQSLGITTQFLKENYGDLNAVLLKLADGYEAADVASNRNASSVTLMGRSVSAILPLMAEGSDGLKKMFDQADETGSIFNDKLVAAFHQTHENLTELGASFKGVGGTIFAIFEPAIDDAIVSLAKHEEATTKAVKATGGFQSAIGNTAKLLEFGISGIKEYVAELEMWATKVSAVLGAIAQIAAQRGEGQASILSAMHDVIDQADQDEKKAIDDIKDHELAAINEINQAMKNVGEAPSKGTIGGGAGYTGVIGPDGGSDSTGVTDAEQQFDWMIKQNLKDIETQEEANKKAAEAYTKDWNEAFGVVDKAMDGMLQGILTGTETTRQAMAKFFDNMAITAIEDIAKIMVKAAALQVAMQVAPGSGATNALSKMVPSFLGGSGSLGGSTPDAAMLNLTAALTANTAALTGQTVSTDATIVSTDANTASSESGIAAWLANTVATISNTVATEAGDVGKLMGFDVGTASLPFTGPIMAHKGEMILPPDISAQVRSGNMTIGAGPLGAGPTTVGGGGDQYNITIQAIDTQTGASFIQQNARNIVAALSQQARNGNPMLRMPTAA